ncbi:MAG: MFS transporter [Gammaproteobacteria bacterium]|nr:MFS transporter [Gammaproteobacteria bacterium]
MSFFTGKKINISEDLYELLTEDSEGRFCDDIDESACREAPNSFVLLLFSYILTKLGDAIASPKTTLAWASAAVGAPAFVTGFLVPLRESGSMIPQLFIGSAIRSRPVRKWIWVSGSVGQALCVMGIGLSVWLLEGAAAGWMMLGLVALFSIARAFSSVAAKDVLGKTIPKPRRGQLTGWSASAAGFLSVGVGVALALPVATRLGVPLIGALLIAAGVLWLVAAALYAQIGETPGETGGGRNALESLQRAANIYKDKPFRRFVLTRALLMCSALSAPFYVALAQQYHGSKSYLLGAFVAAAGVASLVSAPLWGRFADRSSKHVMIVAALVTAGAGILTFASDQWLPGVAGSLWLLPLLYFVLSAAHSGVRVGRKTYVVNLGSGNKRTDYVAISNTTIGVLLLVVGSVGLLVPLIGNGGVIGVLSGMGLAGAVLATSLPQVE